MLYGAGQYTDAKTGLYYNGFRYYDLLTGRYLQPDPLGLSGGLNSYTYALNNPLRYIDPEGQHPVAILLSWTARFAVGWAIDYLIGYLPDNECNPLLSPQRWANAVSYAIGISAAQKGVKALTAAAKLRRGLGGAGKGTSGQIAQKLPTTRVELHADLKSKGFTSNGQSQGGYETWKGPDGVTVTIKPTGEVIRTQKVWKADGSGKYSERQDYSGNRLPDQSHSTGHFVE